MLIRFAAILVVSMIVIGSAAAQSDPVEKVKLITSTGIDNFTETLTSMAKRATGLISL